MGNEGCIDHPKYGPGDRFIIPLTKITGEVKGFYPSRFGAAQRYCVRFDGETVNNLVTVEFFDSITEPVRPTPQEVFAGLEVGDRFRYVDDDGQVRLKINEEFYVIATEVGAPVGNRIANVTEDIEPAN